MSGLADRLRRLLGGGPPAAAATPAARELSRLQVPFTTAEFLERIRQGDYGIARLFLDAGMSPSAADEQGTSALMMAAAVGNRDIVDALLERGAEVDARNPSGMTALMWCAASRTSSLPVLERLLAAGADPSASANGLSALPLAATRGNGEAARALARHPRTAKEFGERLKVGPLDVIDQFLSAGMDPNVVVTDNGMRALALAALFGQAAVVARLLAAGADVESADAEGLTALMWALNGQRSSVPLVQALLDHGADVDRPDGGGLSAATMAVMLEGIGVSSDVARLVTERSRKVPPGPANL
jgi:ankyrin repeat protein